MLVGTMVAALAMSSATSAKAGVTTVRVAVTSADAVPVHLGMMQGIFARAGLKVTIVRVASPWAAVSAVANGRADFGAADTAVLLSEALRKPLVLVAGSTTATNGMSAMLVPTSSLITTPSGLTEVSIGVPERNGLAQLQVPAWLANVASVDGSGNQFPVFPSGRAVAALKGNTVQAVVTVWPYTGKTEGVRSLGDPIFTELGAGATTSAWFATKASLGSKAKLSRTFVTALARAIAGTKNKASARQAIAATGAPATAKQLNYAAKLNADSLDEIGLQLLSNGKISEQPDTATLIWRQAPKS